MTSTRRGSTSCVDDLRAGRLDDEVPPHGTLEPGPPRRAACSPTGLRTATRIPPRPPRPSPPSRPRRPRHPPHHGGGCLSTPATWKAGPMTITDAPRIVSSPARQAPLLDARVLPGRRWLPGPAGRPGHDPRRQSTSTSTPPTSWAGAARASKPAASGACSARPEPVYLTVNGDESEPATFKDHALIEGDPHLLIEGALICAYAIQAPTRSSCTSGASSRSPSSGSRPPSTRPTPTAPSAATSSAATSPSTWWSTPVPGPTSAARRPPCSRAWRASAAIPASSRPFSLRLSGCTARRPSSTTSRPSPTCPG